MTFSSFSRETYNQFQPNWAQSNCGLSIKESKVVHSSPTTLSLWLDRFPRTAKPILCYTWHRTLIFLILSPDKIKWFLFHFAANQIQVSESTYQLLCRHIAYNLGKSGYITTEVCINDTSIQSKKYYSLCIGSSKSQHVVLYRPIKTSKCTPWMGDAFQRTWPLETVRGEELPGCRYSWNRRHYIGSRISKFSFQMQANWSGFSGTFCKTKILYNSFALTC